MSHATVLVALPLGTPNYRASIEEAIDYQMKPFDENGSWFADGSRWDWYSIGGRWSGCLLPDYDPRMDPLNWERCNLCIGSPGTRNVPVPPGNTEWKPTPGKCNGCSHQGELPDGMRVKWPTQWVDVEGGNIATAGQLKKRFSGDAIAKRGNSELFAFFAFLKDRVWTESGRMSWFGCTAKPEDEIRGEPKEVMRFRHDDGSEAIIVTHKEEWEPWEAAFKKRFVDDLPDDQILVVVDYHV